MPKSKRLSSFIWILVLWGIARIFSELNGLGWERTFYWNAPILFGAFPASAFLVLAIITKDLKKEKMYRWAALLSVVCSVSGLLAIGTGSSQEMGLAQGVLFGITLLAVVGYSAMCERQARS